MATPLTEKRLPGVNSMCWSPLFSGQRVTRPAPSARNSMHSWRVRSLGCLGSPCFPGTRATRTDSRQHAQQARDLRRVGQFADLDGHVAGLEHALRVVRVGEVEIEGDVRIAQGEFHERFGQEVRAEVGGHVDPQRADRGVDQLLQFFMGDLGLGHDQLAAFEVQAAGVGQFDLARGAAEQAQPHGAFEFGHLARQSRLGDAQAGGGAAETMRLGHFDEELHAL